MAREHINSTLRKIGATCRKEGEVWICVSKNKSHTTTGATKRSAVTQLLTQYGIKSHPVA